MPNRSSKPKRIRPRDVNQLAKSIVDESTVPRHVHARPPNPDRSIRSCAAAAEMGRCGGLKGGPARAKKLGKKKLSESARKAANAPDGIIAERRTQWKAVQSHLVIMRHDSHNRAGLCGPPRTSPLNFLRPLLENRNEYGNSVQSPRQTWVRRIQGRRDQRKRSRNIWPTSLNCACIYWIGPADQCACHHSRERRPTRVRSRTATETLKQNIGPIASCLRLDAAEIAPSWAPEGMIDPVLQKRLFAEDKDGSISLKVLPSGSEDKTADALFLILFGFLAIKDQSMVTAAELLLAAKQSGVHLDRVDRAMDKHRSLFSKGGSRRKSIRIDQSRHPARPKNRIDDIWMK